MPFHPQASLASIFAASGGGGGGGAPALPTITTPGQTPIFRLYSDAPTGHLYTNTALTAQAAAGQTVMGIKDLSAAHNNFADTQAGAGAVLTAAAINGKQALAFDGTNTLLESDNTTNVDILRTSTNIAMLAVFKLTGVGADPQLMMSTTKANTNWVNCFIIKLGGGATYFVAGRWGGNSSSNFPLSVFSNGMNASWADFGNKTLKFVMRTATGTGSVQRLNLAVSDGTTTATATATYTNNGTDDVDSSSTPWDYATMGGWYYGGGARPGVAGYLSEAVLWSGTQQMSDTDVASLMTYAAGTAGF